MLRHTYKHVQYTSKKGYAYHMHAYIHNLYFICCECVLYTWICYVGACTACVINLHFICICMSTTYVYTVFFMCSTYVHTYNICHAICILYILYICMYNIMLNS